MVPNHQPDKGFVERVCFFWNGGRDDFHEMGDQSLQLPAFSQKNQNLKVPFLSQNLKILCMSDIY